MMTKQEKLRHQTHVVPQTSRHLMTYGYAAKKMSEKILFAFGLATVWRRRSLVIASPPPPLINDVFVT
jgi:hypothetical protein